MTPNKPGTMDETPPLESNTLIVEDQSLKRGFVQLPKIILYARNLTLGAKVLYAVLLGYAWQEDRCFPGYTRLRQDLQVSDNTVRKYMGELRATKLLRQQRRGQGKTNLYILTDLRTAKIEVQEPPSLRTAKSEVQDTPKSEVPDDQKLRGEVEAVEEETEEVERHVENSNVRNAVTDETISSNPETSPESQGNSEQILEGKGSNRAAQVPSRSRERPETMDEDYQRIQECIIDRAREFYDTASIKSSTTRAYRMYQRSELSVERFIDHIFQARAITQERTAAISKTTKDSEYNIERKTKMAYFFAVLEDHLGLAPPRPRRSSGAPPNTGQPESDDFDYDAYIEH